MSHDLTKLRDKLCRELAQSEHDAVIQVLREARRLGTTPPAEKLRAVAAHAEHLRPQFDALVESRQPVGARVGRIVGEIFSGIRFMIADRVLSTERSYRATILGLRHGLDCARLLRDVARRGGHEELARFCSDLIEARTPMLDEIARCLGWFAENSEIAQLSGGRLAMRARHDDRALALP
jgi:hypothetical protein